ncbi:hypothetical protein VNO78_14905 [Psophocarpus tetragonolobus]|uniref:Uncharacterized protein n=1 Tax=Psophocarpus tetragonolobus TaxID=3891 RepID=A0AAN9XJ92_PSOTE
MVSLTHQRTNAPSNITVDKLCSLVYLPPILVPNNHLVSHHLNLKEFPSRGSFSTLLHIQFHTIELKKLQSH